MSNLIEELTDAVRDSTNLETGKVDYSLLEINMKMVVEAHNEVKEFSSKQVVSGSTNDEKRQQAIREMFAGFV